MSTIAVDRGLTLVRTVPRTAGRRTPAPGPAPAAQVGVAGLRLTRRGRWTLTVLALLVMSVVIVATALFSAQGAQADAPADSLPVATHTVVAGETLWSVALSLTAPGEDVRDVVDMLAELNGLSGSSIQAGQLLLVPAG